MIVFAALFWLRAELWQGWTGIVFSKDSLITDYIALAGAGRPFSNAGAGVAC